MSADLRAAVLVYLEVIKEPGYSWVHESQMARAENRPNREVERMARVNAALAEVRRLASRPVPTEPGAPDPDAAKLRVLATWFDNFDDWREATGKIAPGIAEYREVQQDLRRIADRLASRPVPAPEPSARLREALDAAVALMARMQPPASASNAVDDPYAVAYRRWVNARADLAATPQDPEA